MQAGIKPKKVVLFPEIGRVKIYVYKQKNKNTKKAKETEEEKRTSPENRLKKNLQPTG